MKYIGFFAITLALLGLFCACTPQTPPPDYSTPTVQTGKDYESSWTTGLSKDEASQNPAVASWLAQCSAPERDGIGHYVLRNTKDNGDGTSTHHLLIYRSATEKDAQSFDVSFAVDGNLLTVTPTYTSAKSSEYGYDLIYLTLRTDSDVKILVELLVDNDYPGQIITKVDDAISPDTFG